MTVFSIQSLSKKFGSFSAFDNVNLELKKNEILGFLGPNGAGKSTTIRVLLGILKASSGNVSVLGLDPWVNASEIHKNVVYVPGEVNLWPSLSGGEIIDFLAKLHKIDIKSKNYLNKKEFFIKKFDLDPSKKSKQYSKGNKQKVILISAFLISHTTNIKLAIFDEPTSGLDPLMEEKFVEEVKSLKTLGISVFLSSHILSEVEKLCDRVAIIKDGKIIKSGTVDEIKAAHGEGESLESAFLENYE